ncbi:DUF4190 domain-containing protein [Luteolibacter ambystomatis]|uniref:DUF4190 domain-containing protein n=1 Tax=Luteolibacter ambystomatis TaxID=2824561 RepID=A0A975G9E6_9BACT|nr:DUF4190 domain-containing protein [Luteolibacter ambystomatis]QUE51423.1 DUF4190 domain-containing protein [Luteolibacter ambystomatis]
MAHWHYGENGQHFGPVDENGIRQAIAAGAVQPHTLVWREGMPDWLPLSQVSELVGPVPVAVPYPQAPYGAVPYVPSSGLAIASMVCGIVSLFLCYFAILGAIPAVICGHLALTRIKESPIPMGGRGMAIAGLVLGYTWIGLTIVAAIAISFAVSTHP